MPSRDQLPHPFPDPVAHQRDPGHALVVDLVQRPPHRRDRRHRPEQPLLIPQHRGTGQVLRAVRDRRPPRPAAPRPGRGSPPAATTPPTSRWSGPVRRPASGGSRSRRARPHRRRGPRLDSSSTNPVVVHLLGALSSRILRPSEATIILEAAHLSRSRHSTTRQLREKPRLTA